MVTMRCGARLLSGLGGRVGKRKRGEGSGGGRFETHRSGSV